MKVLVIDDDHGVRHTLSKMLRSLGHEVATASNGGRGMEMMKAEPPQIVITDILMPEQEGFETIIKLRREAPDVKILAISGGFAAGDYNLLSMAHALGADDILAKPFGESDLVRALNRVATGSSLSRFVNAD